MRPSRSDQRISLRVYFIQKNLVIFFSVAICSHPMLYVLLCFNYFYPPHFIFLIFNLTISSHPILFLVYFWFNYFYSPQPIRLKNITGASELNIWIVILWRMFQFWFIYLIYIMIIWRSELWYIWYIWNIFYPLEIQIFSLNQAIFKTNRELSYFKSYGAVDLKGWLAEKIIGLLFCRIFFL